MDGSFHKVRGGGGGGGGGGGHLPQMPHPGSAIGLSAKRSSCYFKSGNGETVVKTLIWSTLLTQLQLIRSCNMRFNLTTF